MTVQTATVDDFYRSVMAKARLRTPNHAVRSTNAVLHTLGFNLSSGTKKKLAKVLPDHLAAELMRGWRLIHFRDRNMTLHDFAKDVGYHSGNTDPQYAPMVVEAVFHNIKEFCDDDLIRLVARDLSPEVRRVWVAA